MSLRDARRVEPQRSPVDDLLRGCLMEAGGTAGYLSVRLIDGLDSLVLDTCVGRDGRGVPASTKDLLHFGCVAKPLLPLLFATSALQALDALIEIHFQDATEPQLLSFSQLVSHGARIASPTAIDWRLNPLGLSDDLVQGTLFESDVPIYNDFAPWVLLEQLFVAECGRDAGDALRSDVLRPLGVATDVVVDGSKIRRYDRERICVPVIREGGLDLPMYSEALFGELRTLRPAFGALATCAAMANIYEGLLRVLEGSMVAGLPSRYALERLLLMRGDPVTAPSLSRSFSFAGGFMSNHVAPAFSSLSSECFGHVGGAGLGGAFADPASGVVAAYYFNSMRPDGDAHAAAKEHLLSELAGMAHP